MYACFGRLQGDSCKNDTVSRTSLGCEISHFRAGSPEGQEGREEDQRGNLMDRGSFGVF